MLRKADADVEFHIANCAQVTRRIATSPGISCSRTASSCSIRSAGTFCRANSAGGSLIDANPPKPPVALEPRAPGLSLRALALMLGLPSDAAGSLEVDANLNGAGDSLHVIAVGLNGTLGLAMVNGEIDNSSLNRLLGPILTSASLPLSLINPGQSIRGSSALRCFAARLDAHEGLATFRALYLDFCARQGERQWHDQPRRRNALAALAAAGAARRYRHHRAADRRRDDRESEGAHRCGEFGAGQPHGPSSVSAESGRGAAWGDLRRARRAGSARQWRR